MSQGKQSKFLTIYFSVLGVGALGLGYLAWAASESSDDAEKKYKDAAILFKTLDEAPLSRTQENADEKKRRVDAYAREVKDLNDTLTGYQAPINGSETNEGFQKKLNEVTKAVRERAAAKGVKLDPKFDLGLGNYLSQFPVSGAAPRLSAELDGIVFLTDAALDAGVLSIDSLTRTPLDFEKEKAPEAPANTSGAGAAVRKNTPAARAAATPANKPAPGPVVDESKVLERQPITITVTGKNKSTLAFLQTISNAAPGTAPHFFTIRTLRIENESKDGPPKSIKVEPKEEQENPEDKSSPTFMRDATYLLGNEKVKMRLDLDLVRFVALPEELETGAVKPAPKPAAAPKPATTPAAPAPAAPAPASSGQ